MRLNSAISYITAKDMLGGRQADIHVDRKVADAPQQQRQIRRQQAAGGTPCVSLSR